MTNNNLDEMLPLVIEGHVTSFYANNKKVEILSNFSGFSKDENSPSYTCYAKCKFGNENGTLYATKHDDLFSFVWSATFYNDSKTMNMNLNSISMTM